MEAIIKILENFGTAGLNIFWLPVGIWTVIALLVTAVFKVFENKISAVYQYHGRVALLWGLPAGVISSALLHYWSAGTTETSTLAAKFIVIQNPISVTATASETTLSWFDPTLWLGVATLITILFAFGALLRMLVNFITLHSFARDLTFLNSLPDTKLSERNKVLLSTHCNGTLVAFSGNIDVPFTFGWRQKRVVLPQHLHDDPAKLNIALRHELMHIRHYDYVLNATLQIIKSLFCIHPLVHHINRKAGEYRELYCDQNVLNDTSISQKVYAQLLFELAPKSLFRTPAAVSMAVEPSTLKKRIQTMKNATYSTPSLKQSLILMLVTGLFVAGLMACSDIEDNGITRSEVEQTQSQMIQAPEDGQPLYVVNGEIIQDKEKNDKLTRLKPEYIESIEVLKDQKATEQYGDAGKNGVIRITLIDKEKAYSDLKEEPTTMTNDYDNNTIDGEDIYVAVENAPELKEGITSLHKKVNYPERCKQAEIEGKVTVQFIVNKNGNVENPNVIRGIGGGCDEEALRVVSQAQFEPGMQRGKPVNVQMSVPIMFDLKSTSYDPASN